MLRVMSTEEVLPQSFVLTSSAKAKPKNEQTVLPQKKNTTTIELKVLENRSADGNELRIIVTGCQGNGQQSQKQVAQLLNDYIKNNPNKCPDFILLTGDNIYESGPSSSSDPGFKNCFEDIYLPLPYLRDIPFFVILGNHDENLHRARLPGSLKGVKRGLFEVAYSYLHPKSKAYATPLDPNAVPKNTNIAHLPPDTYMLDQNNLPTWNMPSRTYSLVKGNTELLCIDSNTYVKDYLDYLDYQDYLTYMDFLKHGGKINPNNYAYQLTKKYETTDSEQLIIKLTEEFRQRKIINESGLLNPTNQAKWLADKNAAAKKAGRKTILALHHPPFTPGKRAYESDIDLYLKSPHLERVIAHFNQNKEVSYNTLIRDTLREQKLYFDTILAAHDHDIYYYNNKKNTDPVAPLNNNVKNGLSSSIEFITDTDYYPMCQITCGGGGGKLQDRLGFIDQQFMGCFLKHHGFTEVECDEKDPSVLHYSIHTVAADLVPSYHLKFTNKSCTPMRDFMDIDNAERIQIERFCDTVKKAVHGYFGFINLQQEEARGKYLGKNPFYGNLSHGTTGVERAHRLWAYVSNHQVDNYKTTVEKIYEIAKWDQSFISSVFTSPKEHSLITYINEEITATYGKGQTLKSIYTDAKRSVRKSFEI